MTTGIVAFDYQAWATRYPELAASVNQTLATAYFSEAQLYCDNTPCSLITDSSVGGMRSMLLNMVTAHIAAINASLNGQPASPLVGQITNASEGSVSVAVKNDYPAGSPQWFQQTKYGAAFWAATAQFRTARYYPGCVRNQDPYAPYPYGVQ